MDVDWDIVWRLVVAAGLGGAIGLEREMSDQPAGLRTHLAVAVGAALFGVISVAGFSEFETTQRATNIQFDVTRVASIVASGIGFIGAGLIFRHGTSVRNLTTAASVWVTAAVGLACGVGDFAPALAAVVVVLVGLVVLRFPRTWIRNHIRPEQDDLRVVLVQGAAAEDVIEPLHALHDVDVKGLAVEKDGGAYVVRARVVAARGVDAAERLGAIARLPVVHTMTVGAGPAE
jgi:putative Mg2+ transporter-C (MgtC) family protein